MKELINGKCRNDFDRWYSQRFYKYFNLSHINKFYMLPDSMQFGALVDFFDENEIFIETPFYWGTQFWKVEISELIHTNSTHLVFSEEGFKTRPEARRIAIEKAVEIYNSK